MSISIFDLFSIGIGPSSSHTIGPMRAARQFILSLQEHGKLEQTTRVTVGLFGSLALTGAGHATDRALLLGLEGERPSQVDASVAQERPDAIRQSKSMKLNGSHLITFDLERDLIWHPENLLPRHSNGMQFRAYDEAGALLSEGVYYSIGGGFIVNEDGEGLDVVPSDITEPYPFTTAKTLLSHCEAQQKSIADILRANEVARMPEADVHARLMRIWDVMRQSVERGLHANAPTLPGGLDVRRRAPALYRRLTGPDAPPRLPGAMDWLSVYAIAVNEENAAGGQVVTAPTNGAAGVIPAVLYYYTRHAEGISERQILDFLLTAGAIGILYKHGASISAAEVGCQGEVGVACSMAAGATAALLGGNPAQAENAAEIGMEHNLGLTCDPIGGLVQIPCIERNAMGAVKAVNAARLAVNEEGEHKVSLDKVIATMLATGRDMTHHYKETSLGGLAVNVPEC